MKKVQFIVTDDSGDPALPEISVSAEIELLQKKGKWWRVSGDGIEAFGDYRVEACANWIRKRFPTGRASDEGAEAEKAAGKPFESAVRELFSRSCTEHQLKSERTQHVSIPAHACMECVRLALEKASSKEPSSADREMSSADLCRRNGWKSWTLLVGNPGNGHTVIKIMALGEEAVLARAISRNGESVLEAEKIWALRPGVWRLYGK